MTNFLHGFSLASLKFKAHCSAVQKGIGNQRCYLQQVTPEVVPVVVVVPHRHVRSYSHQIFNVSTVQVRKHLLTFLLSVGSRLAFDVTPLDHRHGGIEALAGPVHVEELYHILRAEVVAHELNHTLADEHPDMLAESHHCISVIATSSSRGDVVTLTDQGRVQSNWVLILGPCRCCVCSDRLRLISDRQQTIQTIFGWMWGKLVIPPTTKSKCSWMDFGTL